MDEDLRERLLQLAKEDAARREEREVRRKKRSGRKKAAVKVHDIPFDWTAVDREFAARGRA